MLKYVVVLILFLALLTACMLLLKRNRNKRKAENRPGITGTVLTVLFWVLTVFAVLIPAGVIASIFLGERYDFLFMYPAIISFLITSGYMFWRQFQQDWEHYMKKLLDFDYDWFSAPQRKLAKVIFGVLFGVTMLANTILMAYGGNPELSDGAYVTVSHGQIIRSISENEYILLHTLSRYSWCGFVYTFQFAELFSIRNDCLKISAGK